MLCLSCCSECQRHLVEPELRLLSPASRMLQAVASGCDQACAAITMATVPVLLGQFTRRTMVGRLTSTVCVWCVYVCNCVLPAYR